MEATALKTRRWPDGKLENESLVSHFPTGPTTTTNFPHPYLFYHSANRTFHLLQKPDTLICYQQKIRTDCSRVDTEIYAPVVETTSAPTL